MNATMENITESEMIKGKRKKNKVDYLHMLPPETLN